MFVLQDQIPSVFGLFLWQMRSQNVVLTFCTRNSLGRLVNMSFIKDSLIVSTTITRLSNQVDFWVLSNYSNISLRWQAGKGVHLTQWSNNLSRFSWTKLRGNFTEEAEHDLGLYYEVPTYERKRWSYINTTCYRMNAWKGLTPKNVSCSVRFVELCAVNVWVSRFFFISFS